MRTVAAFAVTAVVCSLLLGCSSGGKADGPSAVASSRPAVAAITTPPIAMRDYPFYDRQEGCSQIGDSLGDFNAWGMNSPIFSTVAFGRLGRFKDDPLCKAVTFTVYTAKVSRVGRNVRVTHTSRQVVRYDGRTDVAFRPPSKWSLVLVFWGKPHVKPVTLKSTPLNGTLLWDALLAHFNYSTTVPRNNGGHGLLWVTTSVE